MRADGSFVINGVPPGEHRVAVVEAGGMSGAYVTVIVDPGEDEVIPPVRPELGGQIVGMVTVHDEDGVRVLPGVEVTAQPAYDIVMGAAAKDEDSTFPLPELPSFSGFTDENGSYILPAVPTGEYVVTVAAPEYTENYQWVWVEAGHTAVADFELRPAIDPGVGTVRGRVMADTEDGLQPVVGALVSIYSEEVWYPVGPPCIDNDGGEENGGGSNEGDPGDDGVVDPDHPAPDEIPCPWFYGVSTLTDSQGNYSLNAPAGYASIEVFASEYMSVWEEIVIRADQVLERNYTLEPWEYEEMRPPSTGTPSVP